MEQIIELLYEGVEPYPASTNEVRIRNPFPTNMAVSSSSTQFTSPESKETCQGSSVTHFVTKKDVVTHW
jgi:hypothetical protein